MTLGIMQPYFFPYLGYYQLMMAVDRWIVFDVVKYNRKSWMNRNRVLHPREGWQYVSVPVHAESGDPISAVTVVDGTAARSRILGQLEHYRGKAPFHRQVVALIEEVFASARTNKLRDLDIQSLDVVGKYLGLKVEWAICSELDLQLPDIAHPGQWALEIATAFGATRYVNLPGGHDLFVPREWEARGIELRFLAPPVFKYETGPYVFCENLSIIDVLMWNDAETVAAYMADTMRIVS